MLGGVGLMLIAVLAQGHPNRSDGEQPPPPPPDPEVIVPDARALCESMLLDETQYGSYMESAQHGDGYAAFRLSRHFSEKGADETARFWMRYSAARGYAHAQFNSWYELSRRGDCVSTAEALAWLESAAVGGSERARDELVGYRKTASNCGSISMSSYPRVSGED